MIESTYLQQRRNKMMGIAAPAEPKEKKPIAKVSAKKAQEFKEGKPNRDELNEWFAVIEEKECANGYAECWECGAKIQKAFMRAATAHVLPKRKNMFPSVATHPNNYLILGPGCGCHNRYDNSWEDAAQMRVWPLAVNRFMEMYSLIPTSERKNIPEVLIQEISPELI